MFDDAPANFRADPRRLAGPAPIVLNCERDIAEAASHCNKPRREMEDDAAASGP